MTAPVPSFANDDQAAQHWLALLRSGTDDQKILAREQLASIFERRGMFEEATDLLVSNVRAGVRNADIFRWLARLYRAQGDEVTAMQAAAEAAKYLSFQSPPVVEPTVIVTPAAPPRPATAPMPTRSGSALGGCVAVFITLIVLGIGGVVVLALIGMALGGSGGSVASRTATTVPGPASVQRPASTAVPTRPSVNREGRGRTATDLLTPPSAISVMKLKHEGSSNFVVKAIRSGSRDDLMVNEIGRYEGSRPLIGDAQVMFDIQADGRWTLDLVPLPVGGYAAFSGYGDDVSAAFDPPSRGPWTISHDGKSNFVVKLHCAGGSTLVENSIGSVNGSTVVTFGRGPCFWEVEADGLWKLAPR